MAGYTIRGKLLPGISLLLAICFICPQIQAQQEHIYKVMLMPDGKEKVDSILNVINSRRKDQQKDKRMDRLFKEAFRVAEKIKYDQKEPELYNAYGVYKRDFSEFYEALQLHKKALSLAQKQKNTHEEIKALNNAGVVYRRIDENSIALDYLMQGLKLAEKTGDDYSASVALNSIGNIHIVLGNYRDAIKYFQQCLPIAKKGGNDLGIAINLNNIGEGYERLGLLDTAEYYYRQSLDVNIKIKEKQGLKGVAIGYNSLGNVLKKQGKLNEAMELFKKAFVINEQKGDKIYVANSYNNFGGIYFDKKDYAKSLTMYQKALSIGLEIGSKYEVANAYEGLMNTAEISGDLKNALAYSQNFKRYNDSIVNENNSRHVREMEAIYGVEKEQARIALLETNRKNDRIIMLGSAVLFVLLLISGVLFYLRNRLLERNRSLQRELEIRSQIASDLHDDMGSSLSSIHIFSELLRKDGNDKHELLSKIEANAKDTLEALDDIIWLVKPSNDKFSNLSTHIREFSIPLFESKDIDFEIDFPESISEAPLPMETRRNIFLIIKESVNNLVKYSECTKASIKVFNNESALSFVVRDNGKGFDPEKLTNRNGIKNLRSRARQINAVIHINSAPGSGTEIILSVNTKELMTSHAHAT
ncbi:MAG: tetratricopeptide repeat protein [Niabella sp.]